MRIFCVGCGCTPKPDEWAYEGANYCIDCGPSHTCTACKGNGYTKHNGLYEETIIQCQVCDSQGEVHA